MTESPLIRIAKQWVIERYPYNRYHLLQTLVWLDKLAPECREVVRIAALTHDMERAFPGPDQPHAANLMDMDYYKAHAARSARIVSEWVRESGAEGDYAGEVENLVAAHEFGGWPEANLVQAADSLSFLEVNIELFLDMIRSGRHPVGQVREKFAWTFTRIQVPAAIVLALPMLSRSQRKLDALELELADTRRAP